MSRARHGKHKASGGAIAEAGGNPHVLADAKAKKKGGAVKNLAMHGAKARHRLDRRGRKAGGRVGANLSPLSTAHNASGG